MALSPGLQFAMMFMIESLELMSVIL